MTGGDGLAFLPLPEYVIKHLRLGVWIVEQLHSFINGICVLYSDRFFASLKLADNENNIEWHSTLPHLMEADMFTDILHKE